MLRRSRRILRIGYRQNGRVRFGEPKILRSAQNDNWENPKYAASRSAQNDKHERTKYEGSRSVQNNKHPVILRRSRRILRFGLFVTTVQPGLGNKRFFASLRMTTGKALSTQAVAPPQNDKHESTKYTNSSRPNQKILRFAQNDNQVNTKYSSGRSAQNDDRENTK